MKFEEPSSILGTKVRFITKRWPIKCITIYGKSGNSNSPVSLFISIFIKTILKIRSYTYFFCYDQSRYHYDSMTEHLQLKS